MFNATGIKFINDRTKRLEVDSIEKAAEVLFEAIEKRDARIREGNPLSTDTTIDFARHLAWITGFDALVEQRAEIHHITSKLQVDG
jgi:hypothetical protein